MGTINNRKVKYAWFILIIIALYGLTLVTISSLWIRPTDNDLVIKGQQCGCPCPEAKVVTGEIAIPKSILENHTNIRRDELTLTGNSPFKPYNYETGHSEILIEGEVIGIDTTLCSPTDWAVAPKFKVENWILTSYSARFWTWNKTAGMSYLFGIPLVSIALLTLTLVRRKKK